MFLARDLRNWSKHDNVGRDVLARSDDFLRAIELEFRLLPHGGSGKTGTTHLELKRGASTDPLGVCYYELLTELQERSQLDTWFQDTSEIIHRSLRASPRGDSGPVKFCIADLQDYLTRDQTAYLGAQTEWWAHFPRPQDDLVLAIMSSDSVSELETLTNRGIEETRRTLQALSIKCQTLLSGESQDEGERVGGPELGEHAK